MLIWVPAEIHKIKDFANLNSRSQRLPDQEAKNKQANTNRKQYQVDGNE